MRQRCYCLTAHHQPLVRRDEEVRDPRDGEVLVRVLGAGVCHSDIHIWEGEYDLGGGRKLVLQDRGVSLPLVMGHEIAGRWRRLARPPRGSQSATRFWSIPGSAAASAPPAGAARRTCA
jgi:propanol-preferring alcohol dehydrogenase